MREFYFYSRAKYEGESRMGLEIIVTKELRRNGENSFQFFATATFLHQTPNCRSNPPIVCDWIPANSSLKLSFFARKFSTKKKSIFNYGYRFDCAVQFNVCFRFQTRDSFDLYVLWAPTAFVCRASKYENICALVESHMQWRNVFSSIINLVLDFTRNRSFQLSTGNSQSFSRFFNALAWLP